MINERGRKLKEEAMRRLKTTMAMRGLAAMFASGAVTHGSVQDRRALNLFLHVANNRPTR
jgi:hypothetical protein